MSNRFYVDDIPHTKDVSEFPPEIYLERPVKRAVPEPTRYDTAPIIRHMRQSRGISQEELAKRVFRSRSYIAVLETRGGSCRFDTLAIIAEACKYNIVFKKEETIR